MFLTKPVFLQTYNEKKTVYCNWSITTKQSSGSWITYYMVLHVLQKFYWNTSTLFAINECISKNIFPVVLKNAHVTPIYKKSNLLKAENYRPISVTLTLATIFETFCLQQRLEYVEKYEIINKKQFGFLKRKSSNDTVISLTESVNSLLEENETVVSILLDSTKALNSISHHIFFEKITKYGFSTESIAMLESFLSNRKQCVRNGIEYSNWVAINQRVPQGTVLGHLFF